MIGDILTGLVYPYERVFRVENDRVVFIEF